MAGRSFNPYNLNRAAAAVSGIEERAGYKRGQRILHDDYGYGAVVEVKDSEDGPVVRVRFDSGQEERFLSEKQGRAYEKVSEDY
jgi:bifunctional DNA-binding transcriptional regulator/antitoxin component of YhaV-PrlF toxin-antitoxin module